MCACTCILYSCPTDYCSECSNICLFTVYLFVCLVLCPSQIDNPVSLLNQDTSRNFLRSSNPEANYKLFMKATHLEQIVRDYESAQEQQGLMGEKIRQKNEVQYMYIQCI